VAAEGGKNTRRGGGLNCVFKNVSFLRKSVLFSGSESEKDQSLNRDQSLSVQRIKRREQEKEEEHKQFYTGSFHNSEVVLSPLHFQGEFH